MNPFSLFTCKKVYLSESTVKFTPSFSAFEDFVVVVVVIVAAAVEKIARLCFSLGVFTKSANYER